MPEGILLGAYTLLVFWLYLWRWRSLRTISKDDIADRQLQLLLSKERTLLSAHAVLLLLACAVYLFLLQHPLGTTQRNHPFNQNGLPLAPLQAKDKPSGRRG